MPENDVDMSVVRTGGTLTVKANTSKPVIVDVVTYTPGEQSVKVGRGENGGRTLHVTNVVTDVQSLEWNDNTASVTLPKSDDTQYAFLIHDRETAKILDAAVIN